MSLFTYKHIHLEDDQAFIQRSSAEIEQRIIDAISDRGKCVIGCSGGSTPRPVYEELGKLVSIEWDKVTICLIDERYVPSDHEESNQKLLRDTLLRSAPLTENQLILPDTSLPLEECRENYEFQITQFMDNDRMDIAILGMGEDGHIASLFPGDMGALLREDYAVLHARTDSFAVKDRLTVSLPVLRDAGVQIFLLRGSSKKRIFSEVLSENIDCIEYPAHMILATGRSVWITRW